ncbi:hypothetical protein D477_014241 [Arthrobacter crystallopoietes BAB-32]|uniref:Uncharacterized protein n=1 Tax=Arthrobacter crystallopoietes BAB-32 TaxID=1246476 RepID=N1V5M6_9MICC|nr:hypothetical protein [Arthrobacter crystallopoietes]EMY33568.1 hypothetical protein D477_014241 [Arthrobacter crystallopoietes BAB-32]
MDEFTFTVKVKAETREQAERVIAERIYHDECYGSPYEVHVAGTTNDPGTNG